MTLMARLATTSDAFNAIAAPRRRAILELLAHGERSVNAVAHALGVRQPQASKHLSVLYRVGLVDARNAGQRRLYTLNAGGLKPVHDWVRTFERFWTESVDRLDRYLREVQREGDAHRAPASTSARRVRKGRRR